MNKKELYQWNPEALRKLTPERFVEVGDMLMQRVLEMSKENQALLEKLEITRTHLMQLRTYFIATARTEYVDQLVKPINDTLEKTTHKD